MNYAKYSTILFGSICFWNCAGSHNGDPERKAHFKPVPVESLASYKQAYLRTNADTLRNCDTTSDYKLLIKDTSGQEKGREYDRFTTQGYPVLWFTFLKSANDSLYFIGTIAREKSQNAYTSLCLDRKYITQALVENGSDSDHDHHKKGFGGMGRRRRMNRM